MECKNFDFSEENGCSQVQIGFDYQKTITYENVDITNIDFNLLIKDLSTNTTILDVGVVGDATTTGIFKSDAVNGEFKITIRKADNSVITPGVYDYTLKAIDASSLETVFLHGKFHFDGDVMSG